jgi:hypothetical protein
LRASACSAPRGLRDHASPTPGAGQRQSGRPNRRRSHRDEADGST